MFPSRFTLIQNALLLIAVLLAILGSKIVFQAKYLPSLEKESTTLLNNIFSWWPGRLKTWKRIQENFRRDENSKVTVGSWVRECCQPIQSIQLNYQCHSNPHCGRSLHQLTDPVRGKVLRPSSQRTALYRRNRYLVKTSNRAYSFGDFPGRYGTISSHLKR